MKSLRSGHRSVLLPRVVCEESGLGFLRRTSLFRPEQAALLSAASSS